MRDLLRLEPNLFSAWSIVTIFMGIVLLIAGLSGFVGYSLKREKTLACTLVRCRVLQDVCLTKGQTSEDTPFWAISCLCDKYEEIRE